MLKIIGKKTRGQIEAEWSAALMGVVRSGSVPDGDGWFTFNELRERHKLSVIKMRTAINALKETNGVEVYRGAVVVDGVTHVRVWYRLK